MPGRGKRGGARVIYLDVMIKSRIYLLMAYPKNVQENLSVDQKKNLVRIVDGMKGE
jgi:hypothetical protein